MNKIPQMHIWATFSVSIAIMIFFTLSVAFLSHGLVALVVSSALLVLIGVYFVAYYHKVKEAVERKLLALLNVSLALGFFPFIGINHMLGGVIAPYVWLSLVTLNLAYSVGLILYHDMRIEEIFR
ncbi:MAG: hypothetical protein V1836_03995 [Candidatus Aenigmatarchaeota archaeon]